MSASSGSLVVSRCSARPGSRKPRKTPEGCCTAFQSSIVTPIERTATTAPVSAGAPMLGARRSKAAVTGIASAAKFVPQRGEKRLGRAAPVQVVSSERASAAAIARCSAPCRRSVRPRKSQRMISTVVRIPAGSSSRPGSATKQSGARIATRRKRRSRTAGDAATAHERRHRRDQLHQAAQERDPDGRGAPARHLALVQFTRVGRERPEALADDHDAVRTGHAAELRQRALRGRRVRERRRRERPPTHSRRKKAVRRVPDGLIPLVVRPT